MVHGSNRDEVEPSLVDDLGRHKACPYRALLCRRTDKMPEVSDMGEKTQSSSIGSCRGEGDTNNLSRAEDSTRRQAHLDFMSQDGLVVEKLGLRLSHFTLFQLAKLIRLISILIFMGFLVAVLASVFIGNVWHIVSMVFALSLPVAAFLGFRLNLITVFR